MSAFLKANSHLLQHVSYYFFPLPIDRTSEVSMGTPGPRGRGFLSRGEVSKCCSFCGTLGVSHSLFFPLCLLPFPEWFFRSVSGSPVSLGTEQMVMTMAPRAKALQGCCCCCWWWWVDAWWPHETSNPMRFIGKEPSHIFSFVTMHVLVRRVAPSGTSMNFIFLDCNPWKSPHVHFSYWWN